MNKDDEREKNINDINNKKSYCYRCKGETNSKLLFETSELQTSNLLRRDESGEDLLMLYTIQCHQICVYKCLGCNCIHVENKYKLLGDKDWRIETYPKILDFEMHEFVKELPIKYFEMFLEINKALNDELYWIACSGIRTLLDLYITDTIGDIGGFEQKLSEMNKMGYITEKQKEILNSVINAGSASAHRGYKPQKEIMKDIMQIVYNIFENIILYRKAKKINNDVPARHTKNKK